MPMEPALRAMLTQTIMQEPYAGRDAYGKPSYGPPFERPARIQLRVETMTDQSGQERVSHTTVVCDGDLPVTVNDRITVPDGTRPAVQRVYDLDDPDFPGVVHHYELRL